MLGCKFYDKNLSQCHQWFPNFFKGELKSHGFSIEKCLISSLNFLFNFMNSFTSSIKSSSDPAYLFCCVFLIFKSKVRLASYCFRCQSHPPNICENTYLVFLIASNKGHAFILRTQATGLSTDLTD